MKLKVPAYVIFIFSIIIIKGSNGDRTSLKIYQNLQSDIFCFRRLNATHQIGCASHRNGNVGVLLMVENEEEIENITLNPPSMEIIVAMPMQFFNMKNMRFLRQVDKVQGVLILKPNSTEPPKAFSPDQSCPNKNFGFYTQSGNKDYEACKKTEWNENEDNEALGMMFEDWRMPIFIITDQTSIERMKTCYDKFNNPINGTKRTWPFCSAQMISVMLAAKDSETCMRRNKLISNLNEVKTCDPLSDKNVLTTLFPTNKSEEIGSNSVIVVGARLDSFSMFDRLAPGAHSTVTGLVTLLAISKIMADFRDEIKNKNPDKNVLFILFNGEAFDYIGSSRVVFDMQRDVFPVQLFSGIKDQPALMNLSHISHFIELSQLGPPKLPASLLFHTDPVSMKDNPEVSDEVNRLIGLFQSEAKKVGNNIKMEKMTEDLPLPPASFQSFLKKDTSIPGVVIADHRGAFINRYYNSIFDTNETLPEDVVKTAIANTSAIVSGVLYQLLTGEELNKPIASEYELVSGLLECYLRNASCELFRQIADPSMTSRLRVEPYPLYVSVDSGGHTKANAITLYTRYLMAYLTGESVPDTVRKNCTGDSQNQIYQFDWMAGSDANESGICIKSTVMYTIAQSPAYILNDWKSSEYSTWTESVWLESSVRIFLQPGTTQEAVTLVLGIVILLLSITSVYFFNQRSSIIFNTKPLVGC